MKYYDNKKAGEVDFLVDSTDDLSVLPIEVKSGKDYWIHSALDKFLSNGDYDVKRGIVLSNEQRVYTVKGITYMPVYYSMFIVPAESDRADFNIELNPRLCRRDLEGEMEGQCEAEHVMLESKVVIKGFVGVHRIAWIVLRVFGHSQIDSYTFDCDDTLDFS